MVISPPDPVQGLYVHVPFCARKCAYCAFYSEASDGGLVNRYVAALIREIEIVAGDLRPRTVFFGGGTPSLLNLRQWEQVFSALERFNLAGAAEWTVECNPATISFDKAKLLRGSGVNRISMGVQSLDGALLDRLGRIHTREMVFRSFDTLRRAGFDNLNLDLMFAIPGQTMEIWRATLSEALAMGSEHLSCYEVIYEEDTPMFTQLQAGEIKTDEDLACAMYEELIERAAGAGLRQYEVANFAREIQVSDIRCAGSGLKGPTPPASAVDGCRQARLGVGAPALDIESRRSAIGDQEIPAFACRHNVNYWRGGSFYGLGPSATGYVRGVRTKNRANTRLYCEQLEQGRRAIESREELQSLARAGETAAFGLRMIAGWPFDEFRLVTGHDLRVGWQIEMDRLEERGWGRVTSDRFHLTSEGIRFADAAAEMFLR